MLRGQLYRRHVPLCATMLYRCSKAAHNRASNVFMDIHFFRLISLSLFYIIRFSIYIYIVITKIKEITA